MVCAVPSVPLRCARVCALVWCAVCACLCVQLTCARACVQCSAQRVAGPGTAGCVCVSSGCAVCAAVPTRVRVCALVVADGWTGHGRAWCACLCAYPPCSGRRVVGSCGPGLCGWLSVALSGPYRWPLPQSGVRL